MSPHQVIQSRLLATLAQNTRSAPAMPSIRAHSEKVEPVVTISSISKMVFPRTRAGSVTRYAPEIFARRFSALPVRDWGAVCTVYFSTGTQGFSSRRAVSSARSRAWS